jgi:hypothetical protein
MFYSQQIFENKFVVLGVRAASMRDTYQADQII